MKFLVHIHLYYYEQIEMLLNKLLALGDRQYDLFVTMRDDNKAAIAKIRAFKNDAHIVKAKNVGADIWPFLHVLELVNLDDYDFVVKIHSKRYVKAKHLFHNGYNLSGNRWKNMLLSFLSSKKTFDKVIAGFESDEKLGQVGDFRLICKEFQEPIFKQILAANNMKLSAGKVPFVAGTMFVMRAKLFKVLKGLKVKESDFSYYVMGGLGKTEHLIERLFGVFVIAQGYKISDNYHSSAYKRLCYFFKDMRMIANFRHLLYHKTDKDIRIFRLPVVRRKEKAGHYVQSTGFDGKTWVADFDSWQEFATSDFCMQIREIDAEDTKFAREIIRFPYLPSSLSPKISYALQNVKKYFYVRGFCEHCQTEHKMYFVYPLYPDAENYCCESCWMNARARAMYEFVTVHSPKGPIYTDEAVTPLFEIWKGKFANLTGAEFLGEDRHGGEIYDFDGKKVMHQDATRLSFDNEAFNTIISMDVFEHILDYKSALSEYARIMKPGGQLFMHIPFFAMQRLNENVSGTFPQETHGNPIDEDSRSICFWHYGWEFLDDLRAAGLDARVHFYNNPAKGYFGGQCLIHAVKGTRKCQEGTFIDKVF